MRKKYKLTKETKTFFDGMVLHRIRAVRDFVLANGTEVHAGDFGGWVEKEDNLSHCGGAWVGGGAMIFDKARVEDEALVCDNAQVYSNAQIGGRARVYGRARIYGKAWINDNAQIGGAARIFGNAQVYGNAWVYNNALVYDNAQIYGKAEVCEKTEVFGKVEVWGNAQIYGNARVCNIHDYAVFKNTWSSGRYFTYTSSNKMWKVGCFYGTSEELIAKAYRDSELSCRCYTAIVRAQEAVDKAITGDTE